MTHYIAQIRKYIVVTFELYELCVLNFENFVDEEHKLNNFGV